MDEVLNDTRGLKTTAVQNTRQLAALEQQAAPRRLTEGDKQVLTAALLPFRGQPVQITSILGDQESDDYARQLFEVVTSAGWNYIGQSANFQSVIMPAPIGVEVTINEPRARQHIVPRGYNALISALYQLGIVGVKAPTYVNSEVPEGVVVIRVGSKPLAPK